MISTRSLVKAKNNLCLQTFLWAFGLSFIIFLPWMVYSSGYFLFYGDFNVQQIPFYQMIHDSVRSGNIGWSYTTDLGANIIGSYSFYMAGSPFFYLTLLFPSEFVPFMMAPLLMLKFGFAAMFAYMFLRRYVREQRFAMFGALLYAFSGFGIYNIFFNHFHEAMITFPMMLAAIDMFIFEKRKGAVAITVFAASFVNYYFFAGQAVFIFIYWLFRMITGSYKMTLLEFLRFAFEVIIGFAASAVMIIPSVLAVKQNSRVENFPYGWSAVAYSSEQRYIHIAECFFFPPDMPAYANFTPDSNAKWASVAAWLPLFSMAGVFTFYRLKTQKWLKKLILALFIIAFVPVLNASFQLFNMTYYARWFYMLTLMLSMATVISLDHEEADFRPGLIRTIIITFLFTALIGLIPEKKWGEKTYGAKLGLEKYPDRFWVWVAIAIVGLAALTVILCLRKNKKVFTITASIVLSLMIAGYGNVLIGTGVVNANYQKSFVVDVAMANKGVFENDLKDLHNVRSDFYEDMDNMGMYWQIPTIQAFQSIVPGSVMDYYKSIGVERSVGSRPKTDVYGIRSFLSVKYLFDGNKNKATFMTKLDSTEMPGWTKILSKNNYQVYENEYYIPYGFTYDEYVTEKEFRSVAESDRHLLMLKAMVLTPEQAKKYKGVLRHHTDLTTYDYSEDEYFEDCTERKANTCYDLKFENNKFSAKFDAGDSDELVFFSIPYEDGWSAEVNGKAVDIEKVNIGFMAVKVPGGKTSEIVFRYKTPGLAAGALASGCAVVIFVVYMFLWKVPEKRRKIYMCYSEDDEYTSDEIIYPWDKEEPEEASGEFELIPDDPPEVPRRPEKNKETPQEKKTPEVNENPEKTEAPEINNSQKKKTPAKNSGKNNGSKRSGGRSKPKHMKKDPGEK